MNYCDNIVLYVYGELDAAGKTAFEAHLQSCPDCRAELKDYPDVIKRLESLPELIPQSPILMPAKPAWASTLRWAAVAAGFTCLVLAARFIFFAPDTAELIPAQIPVESVSADEWDNGIEDDIMAVSNKTEVFNWNLAPLSQEDSSVEKSLSEIEQKINDLNTEIENDLAGL